jgi:hypothetical protein
MRPDIQQQFQIIPFGLYDCIDLESFLTCDFNAPRVLSLSTKLPHYNLESPCVLRSYIPGHCNLGSHTPTRFVLIYVQYSAIRLPDNYSKTLTQIRALKPQLSTRHVKVGTVASLILHCFIPITEGGLNVHAYFLKISRSS